MKKTNVPEVTQAVADEMHNVAQHRWLIKRSLEAYDALVAIGQQDLATELATRGKKIAAKIKTL